MPRKKKIRKLTMDEFILTIDMDKLKKVNLKNYNWLNRHKKIKLTFLCEPFTMIKGSDAIKCGKLGCGDCPLETKEKTIKFLKEHARKMKELKNKADANN